LQARSIRLDGVAREEAAGKHLLGLADAVRPIDGLRFDRGIPPGVEQEYIPGRSQVQAHATGLDADQEQPALRIGLELLDSCRAITGATVEISVRQAFFGQM